MDLNKKKKVIDLNNNNNNMIQVKNKKIFDAFQKKKFEKQKNQLN